MPARRSLALCLLLAACVTPERSVKPGINDSYRDVDDPSEFVERFERDILTAALEKHSGNISRAARALGLHRQNLQQKLRQLEISAEDFRT